MFGRFRISRRRTNVLTSLVPSSIIPLVSFPFLNSSTRFIVDSTGNSNNHGGNNTNNIFVATTITHTATNNNNNIQNEPQNSNHESSGDSNNYNESLPSPQPAETSTTNTASSYNNNNQNNVDNNKLAVLVLDLLNQWSAAEKRRTPVVNKELALAIDELSKSKHPDLDIK